MDISNDKIRQYRKARGLSQKDLASKTGLSLSTVRRYEAGTTSPPLYQLKMIAHTLEVPYSYLLQKESSKEEQTEEMKFIFPIELGQEIGNEVLAITMKSIYNNNPMIARIISSCSKLTPDGLEKIAAYAADIASNPNYQENGTPEVQ